MREVLWMGVWLLLWAAGGIWLARAAFRLDKGERLLVGFGLGLALESLLANLLARFFDIPAAAWGAAGLTAFAGLGASLFQARGEQAATAGRARQSGRLGWLRAGLDLPFAPGTLAAFAAISLLCFGLGRGMGLFDDFAHLPVVSLLAAGGMPPHFALDPAATYEYHYFLLFTAAQAMRLGDIPPWAALDLMRGLASGLALCLAFAWTRRITRSSLAGGLGAAFLFFASGSRWLLLLLPPDWLRAISGGMEMLGSGAASGADLSAALAGPWAVEGGGAIPFPFAFTNGIAPPGALLQFVANGLTEQAFVLALLLVFSRLRGWLGGLAAAVFFSAMALLTEAGVLLELGGLGLVMLLTAARGRSLRLPKGLWAWLAVVIGGHLLGAWQGSALWGTAIRALGLHRAADYHAVGFQLVFPPTLVSSHLGVLSLGNPGQILVALAELGPMLLALPLLFAWGWKAVRAGRWYEAALAGEAFLGLFMLFVQFTGSEGIRNTSRLYRFPFVLVIFSVPLVWNWLKGRVVLRPGRREPALRWTAGALAAAALLGGLGIFAVELPALQNPVYSPFITEMDARIFDHRWNTLEKGALVFDLVPYRAPTLLGRFTDSSTTWYALKEEWKELFEQPYPADVRAYGFDYAYLDNFNFVKLPPTVQSAWEGTSCAQLVEEAAYEGYWRRLYDVRVCDDRP